jgi:hypothetical protein
MLSYLKETLHVLQHVDTTVAKIGLLWTAGTEAADRVFVKVTWTFCGCLSSVPLLLQVPDNKSWNNTFYLGENVKLGLILYSKFLATYSFNILTAALREGPASESKISTHGLNTNQSIKILPTNPIA